MKRLLLATALLCVQFSADATIRYVRQSGAGTENGNNWANASPDLQLMINQSSSTVLDTILVSAGTYLPNRPADNLTTVAANNRNDAFVFVKNVVVLGGFPSTGNPQLSNRNFSTNETKLSGDIGTPGNGADNCYHVVATLGPAITADFVMDGFTVSDGMANVATSITVNGVLLQERCGAGWNNNGGSPTLRNMVFENNAIGSDGTGFGIAFYNAGNAHVSNTVFIKNNGPASRGGAWFNASGNPVFNNVAMQGNATNVGGAFWNESGNPVLNNVTIAGNSAFAGGGVYANDGNLIFNNSIIFHNTGSQSPGVYTEFDPPFSSATVTYTNSLIQEMAGASNGNLDGTSLTPLFVDPVSGSLAPTEAGNYHLTALSACVNAGNNTLVPAGVLTDLDGFSRIYGAAVDMGAYEYGSTPLGLDIISFTADGQNCSAHLSWSNENEADLNYYEIQKSISGSDFVAEKKVMAIGKTHALYNTILPQTEAVAYYRIVSVAANGTVKYSPILSVTQQCFNADGIMLYPNPAKDVVEISGVQKGQTIRLFDVAGKTVRNKEATKATTTIQLDGLIPGVYYAVIMSSTGQQIKSLSFSIN